LRLDADAPTRQATLLRFLAVEEAWRLGMVPSDTTIRSAAERFRREKAIEGQEDFERKVFRGTFLGGAITTRMETAEALNDAKAASVKKTATTLLLE
jgi:hypothetical protein